METFHIQGVDPGRVIRHQELFVKAWNKVKPRLLGQLGCLLADQYVCNDIIVAFSSLYLNRYFFAYIIEYQKETQSCKVRVNTMSSVLLRINAEKYFINALRLMLES